MPRKAVHVYADGSAAGNPGPGGWGALLVFGPHRKELSAGRYRLTTNNRMELLGAIVALETITEPCDVVLTSDSRYVIDTIAEDRLRRWAAGGWRRSSRANSKPYLNVDLWVRMLAQVERHVVDARWTRGHAGHPENEICDRLATTASANRRHELIDEGYETPVAV